MKTYSIEWEDMDGFAAGLGLDDEMEGESAEDVQECAEYYYFLDRNEDCEGRHVVIITESPLDAE